MKLTGIKLTHLQVLEAELERILGADGVTTVADWTASKAATVSCD